MLNKLKNLLIDEHKLNSIDADAITKWLNSQYNIDLDHNEDDLGYYVDNLRVFGCMNEALSYEFDNASKESIMSYMIHEDIEEQDKGKTVAEMFLEDSEYMKIEETGTYFYFYD